MPSLRGCPAWDLMSGGVRSVSASARRHRREPWVVIPTPMTDCAYLYEKKDAGRGERADLSLNRPKSTVYCFKTSDPIGDWGTWCNEKGIENRSNEWI